MTRIKQTLLIAASATVAVAALAFAQAKEKMDAAAPVVGALAPAYALPDQNGVLHTSAADKGKVVLLAFYPADFTGGCTIEAHSLSAAYPKLKAEGVTVYGVSVQDSKSHKSFCTSAGIPYTLLADTQKTVTTAYGDLIPGAGIANRVTYIIGANGKVAYVDKDVNGHLTTCGTDWAAWVKAHPATSKTARFFHRTLSEFVQAATISKPAPTFKLPNATTGQSISLAALTHGKKAAVVMFISTRCPVSNAYNDRMVSLAKKYSAQGVDFVGIDSDQNEPKTEVASFTKDKGFPFPVLVDRGNKVSDAYNAHVTPETYVINNSGVLVYHGRIDNDMDTSNVKTHELADALDATLAGKPVVKAQTKAFGCSIKRG
jgi:peroxiredoxin